MEYVYQLIQNDDWTEQNARYKFIEEQAEFLEATNSNDDIHLLEEGFDVIQSVLSFFEVRGFSAAEIAAGLEKHNEKLESRGWDRKALWKIEEVE